MMKLKWIPLAALLGMLLAAPGAARADGPRAVGLQGARVQRVSLDHRLLDELRGIRLGVYRRYRPGQALSAADRARVALTWRLQEDVQRAEVARPLPIGKLRRMSRDDLAILYTGIYARRGKPFDDPVITRYFASRRAGYYPNPRYNDGFLSETDRYNLALIRRVEDEKGGPVLEIESVYANRGE